MGELQKESFWGCRQLKCWLINLEEKILMVVFVFKISQVPDLFVELLEFFESRDLLENFLKLLVENKTFELTHCYFNFFKFLIKQLDILVYSVSWVLDCEISFQ